LFILKKQDLILQISTGNDQERIRAARLLKGKVSEDDIDFLYSCHSKENVVWVKNAIGELLVELEADEPQSVDTVSEDNSEIDDLEAIKRDATADIIGKILHELEPIVGGIGLLARELVPDFQDSGLSYELELLDHLLVTFEDWKRVEQQPRINSVDISKLLNHLIDNNRKVYEDVDFVLIIDDGVTFETDSALLNIIFANAIRNSVESIRRKGSVSVGNVVISCGVNGRELWGAVVDNGVGLPLGKNIYKHEFTTKAGHQGRGLTTLNQAVSSLNGSWQLDSDVAGGAKFTLQLLMVK
jgi:signal transduction histidine kinase